MAHELTRKELDRQDAIDNSIINCMNEISEIVGQASLEYDIEWVGTVRDYIFDAIQWSNPDFDRDKIFPDVS